MPKNPKPSTTLNKCSKKVAGMHWYKVWYLVWFWSDAGTGRTSLVRVGRTRARVCEKMVRTGMERTGMTKMEERKCRRRRKRKKLTRSEEVRLVLGAGPYLVRVRTRGMEAAERKG